MKNSNIEVHFENRILSIKFLENAFVTTDDVKEIYQFANQQAHQQMYGVLFEADENYHVTESAIEYIANNPDNVNVLAKAYVVNNYIAHHKMKKHLLVDKPKFKPYLFESAEKARKWLQAIVKKSL